MSTLGVLKHGVAHVSCTRCVEECRGIVYGVAHVRGGGDLGRYWHEEGKLLHKRNTFTDFIACAEHLIQVRFSHHFPTSCLATRGGYY